MNDANVRRYDTLPVLDPVKVGLGVPLPDADVDVGPDGGSVPER